jgi:hypothetical protein
VIAVNTTGAKSKPSAEVGTRKNEVTRKPRELHGGRQTEEVSDGDAELRQYRLAGPASERKR